MSSGPVRQAGERKGWRSRTRDGHQRAAIPGHGKGPPSSMHAGAAGLTVLREGWKPVKGRDAARLDAQHDSPAPRSEGAHGRFTDRVDRVLVLARYL